MKSKLNRIKIVQSIINKKEAQSYAEIGAYKGECFLHIKAPRKAAVDPAFRIPWGRKLRTLLMNPANANNRFFPMTSDAFFEGNSEFLTSQPLDVVFIDGLHTYKQSLQDVINSLEHLDQNGVIILHDCNPPNETVGYPAESLQHAISLNLPGWEGQWCGDVWKTVVYLRSLYDDLNVCVLDCDWGVGVVTRQKNTDRLDFTTEQINNLQYTDLASNRQRFLNLRPPEYFTELIRTLP